MQMQSISYKNITYSLGIISIVMVIILPEVVIDLVEHLVHLFFELISELLFVCFESLESLLDQMVEEIFHTELRATQMIVFSIRVIIALVPLYCLCRRLPRIYFWLTKKLIKAWFQGLSCWENVTFYNKIKIITVSLGCIYFALFVFN